MNKQSLKYFLVFAISITATLTGHAQTGYAAESEIHPSVKQMTPQIGLKSLRVPLPLTISANGPVDPTYPSRPLFCNKEVQKEFAKAFMKTRNGEGRMGLAEAGRSIEFDEGTLTFGSWATTDFGDGQTDEKANRMYVSKDDHSIAVFHTHGNHARPVPSAKDLQGDVPDFVISQFTVYVTIPGTGTYVQLLPAVCR
jgi:hypothetical protein